jgi:hypothetical protein
VPLRLPASLSKGKPTMAGAAGSSYQVDLPAIQGPAGYHLNVNTIGKMREVRRVTLRPARGDRQLHLKQRAAAAVPRQAWRLLRTCTTGAGTRGSPGLRRRALITASPTPSGTPPSASASPPGSPPSRLPAWPGRALSTSRSLRAPAARRDRARAWRAGCVRREPHGRGIEGLMPRKRAVG